MSNTTESGHRSSPNGDKHRVITTAHPNYAALLEHELFQDIPPTLAAAVLAECYIEQVAAGVTLIAPGEANNHLYLLVSGRLQVHLDDAAAHIPFPIEPGECIGEMSIIEERLTSAHVIAAEDSSLVVLPEEVFWNQFVCLPGAVRNLLRVLSRRMRNHNRVTLQTLEQQLRYEHLQKELAAAGKIQANILPQRRPLFPHHPQVEVHATMEPAREVGGDFFDAFALDDRHICIAIGDVSGKGMPAALFMVRVMTLLRMSVSDAAVLGAALPLVNRALCENNEDCMFVTLFVGVLDVKTGRLTYMNGGHNAPLFSKRGNPFERLEVPKGMLLGVYDIAPYEVSELTMRPGDTLLLYTDGVTEAENVQKKLFSLDRLAEVVTKAVKKDMTSLVEIVQNAVLDFADGVPQADDITMLALRYRGDGSTSG